MYDRSLAGGQYLVASRYRAVTVPPQGMVVDEFLREGLKRWWPARLQRAEPPARRPSQEVAASSA